MFLLPAVFNSVIPVLLAFVLVPVGAGRAKNGHLGTPTDFLGLINGDPLEFEPDQSAFCKIEIRWV